MITWGVIKFVQSSVVIGVMVVGNGPVREKKLSGVSAWVTERLSQIPHFASRRSVRRYVRTMVFPLFWLAFLIKNLHGHCVAFFSGTTYFGVGCGAGWHVTLMTLEDPWTTNLQKKTRVSKG